MTLAASHAGDFMKALATAPFLAASGGDAYLVAAIVLGGIAFLLLGLELLLPTSGMLALLCGASAIASVVAMFMWSTTAGLVLLLSYTIAAPFLLLVLLKLWSKSPIVRRWSLQDADSKEIRDDGVPRDADPDADASGAELIRFRRLQSLARLVGQRGVTETPLRPAGFITLDGRRVDAVAESGLIEAGTPVRVVAVIDGTLKVRAEG
ncbi:MAG: NfeD family protein [Phycisphaerales bacterium]